MPTVPPPAGRESVDLVIAIVALITLATVYAVVIWIDKPTPPDRPPSRPD